MPFLVGDIIVGKNNRLGGLLRQGREYEVVDVRQGAAGGQQVRIDLGDGVNLGQRLHWFEANRFDFLRNAQFQQPPHIPIARKGAVIGQRIGNVIINEPVQAAPVENKIKLADGTY